MGQLRVTEQGETINDRYGLQPIALRTFEQGLNTLALAVAGERAETVKPGWETALQLLSEASRARYRAFVHDDPGFFEFFQAVTPVDVIERMQIGSRPLVAGRGQRRRHDPRGAVDVRLVAEPAHAAGLVRRGHRPGGRRRAPRRRHW